ncbi:MAG: adenosine deaminase [Thermomicrobiales bacterium]
MAVLTGIDREFIRRMPKARLHVHLEGSVYPETLMSPGRKARPATPVRVGRRGARLVLIQGFSTFHEVYVEICNCLQDEEDYEFITLDMARRAARQNLRYMEVTFAPVSILNPRNSALPDVVMSGVRSGAEIAAREHDVELQFIFDPVRGRSPEEVLASAGGGSTTPGDRLVGFGLRGLELGNPASRFLDAFELVRSAGAESHCMPERPMGPSVRDALATGAERIGHGVRAIEDERLVCELAEMEMLLEVSPTSNIRLGVYPAYADHPFKLLADSGVRLTVNSDDPPMFDTTLTKEYEVLVEHFDYTIPELLELTKNAIHGSFLDATRQRAMDEAFDREIRELADELGIDLDPNGS